MFYHDERKNIVYCDRHLKQKTTPKQKQRKTNTIYYQKKLETKKR